MTARFKAIGKQGLSLLLSLLMLFSCIGLPAFAEEPGDTPPPAEDGEDIELDDTFEWDSFEEDFFDEGFFEEDPPEVHFICPDCEEDVIGDRYIENEILLSCTEDGSYEEVYYCPECGIELSRETVITDEALGHIEGEAVRENEVFATCTEDGSYEEVIYCSVCGEELSRETVTDPAPGHTEDEAVRENEVFATCTEDGSHEEVICCSVCGEELSRETIADPAPGHTEDEAVRENEVFATCTEDGSYEEVIYCSVCGEELSRETVIVPAGHSWDEGEETIAPTADTEGEMTYTCLVCGETRKETIEKPEDPDAPEEPAESKDSVKELSEDKPAETADPEKQPEEQTKKEPEIRYPAFDQSRTVNGVVVTVKAGEGVFPEGAVLSVKQVPVYQAVEEALNAERDEERNVVVSYTFDIKVINPETEEEYQPADDQSVSVSFTTAEVAYKTYETNVYHITEDEDTGELTAEVLEVSTETTPETGEETTAVVETDGFSLYTIEFTTTDGVYNYHLQCGTSIPVEQVLEKCMPFADPPFNVTNVVCSGDGSLFTAYQYNREWFVAAKTEKAFSGETMTVTLDDGDVLTIKVSSTGKEFYGSIAGIPVADGGNVYFATNTREGKNDPIKWQVIGMGEDEWLLITADQIVGQTCHSLLDGYIAEIYDGFGAVEKDAIFHPNKTDADYYYISPDPKSPWEGQFYAGNLENSTLFMLSAAEAVFYFAGDLDRSSPGWWWLRSGGENPESANSFGCIQGDGSLMIAADGWDDYGGRPAFVLNLRNILLFSKADSSSKYSGKPGDGEWGQLYDGSGEDRKMTLIDSSRNGFKAKVKDGTSDTSATVKAGENLTIQYIGAKKDRKNDYVSAALCSSAGRILYYASITPADLEWAEWEMKLPSSLPQGNYILKVFSEEQWGADVSDYASKPTEISLTVENNNLSIKTDIAGNGTLKVQEYASTGEVVKVDAEAGIGYELDKLTWAIVGDEEHDITEAKSFEMPNANVIVKASFKLVGYKIKTAAAYGKLTVKTSAPRGETVRIEKVEPSPGFELEKITWRGVREEEPGHDITDTKSFTMPAETVIVKASFKRVNYTITKVAEHGTLTVKDSAHHGELVKVKAEADTGYELDKITWRRESETTETDITEKKNFPMPAENVIVTASFKPDTYPVKYDANGGKDAPAEQVKTHGVPLKLSEAKPTRARYRFIGWAESKTAAEAQYQPGDSYTKDAAVTLYALWKPTLSIGPENVPANHTAYLDGVGYPVLDDGTIDLPDDLTPKVIETYTFNDGGDAHSTYPTGLKVWAVKKEADDSLVAVRLAELDDALHYAGCSIRVAGNKGMRMITGIPTGMKSALIGEGLAGCTLEETGTLVAWTEDLGEEDLTLDNAAKRGNAYKKGSADPLFKIEGGYTEFTNVLVNFTDAMVGKDMTLRSYMILTRDGESIVLYGGAVQRSISYVAYQNRNAFPVGSAEYEYVWHLIRLTYGSAYDAEYKK